MFINMFFKNINNILLNKFHEFQNLNFYFINILLKHNEYEWYSLKKKKKKKLKFIFQLLIVLYESNYPSC
jgi:hypothetical protein